MRRLVMGLACLGLAGIAAGQTPAVAERATSATLVDLLVINGQLSVIEAEIQKLQARRDELVKAAVPLFGRVALALDDRRTTATKSK